VVGHTYHPSYVRRMSSGGSEFQVRPDKKEVLQVPSQQKKLGMNITAMMGSIK
jgi:hypothetical protein